MLKLESDPSLLWRRIRVQQTLDQVNQLDNLFIMVSQAFFDPGDFPLQLFLAGDELSQFDESANDEDTDFDGSWGIQDAGGHDGAMLGKTIRE